MARSRFEVVVAVAVVGVCAGALGCGDNGTANGVPGDSRFNVMVIDNGIDLSLPLLQGKVASAHTVMCDQQPSDDEADAGAGGQPDGGAGDGGAGDGAGFDQLKAGLIAALAVPDDSCHLRDGIDAKTPFLPAFAADRLRWNQALRDDQDPFTIDGGLADAMDMDLMTLPFHGTATTGTIAYDAPALRLVLVEVPLIMSAEQAAAGFTCLSQADADLTVALLSDPDVHAAYLAMPQASDDIELADLRASAGVTLVNESFGPVSRFGFEQLELAAGCQLIDVDAYFRVLDELQRDYDEAHTEAGVLFVRAAGNEGAALNSGDDGAQCHPGDPHQLLVGSYGIDGARSSFTNFGDCVDVYAPGEFVVAPLPGDWLAPLSGTSFAAPLTLRLLMFAAPAPFSVDTARVALLADRQPNRNLPLSQFPPALVFDVAAAAKQSALSSSSPSPSPSPSLSAVTSPRALRRFLFPLRWTARHRSR
jgi:subtilisin family serine protease